jgi:putative tRNA adenosine deaminase-associated protein
MAVDDIDYVVAVYRESGQWVASPLPPRAGESLENLVQAIRQFPGEGGNLGFVSIHDDAAVVLRVTGPDVHIFISDASAAEDFSLAAEIIDLVGEPDDDDEFYPHDVFAEIAERLGCGPQFEHARDESGA